MYMSSFWSTLRKRSPKPKIEKVLPTKQLSNFSNILIPKIGRTNCECHRCLQRQCHKMVPHWIEIKAKTCLIRERLA